MPAMCVSLCGNALKIPYWRKDGGKRFANKKGPTALFAVSPRKKRCRRQDLNLHCHYGNQALNLARLPIPPLRRGWLLHTLCGGGPGIQVPFLADAARRNKTPGGRWGRG